MDIRKVKKLIELLEESGIAEIEITEGEEGVRISRYPAGGQPVAAAIPAQAPVPVPVAAASSAPAPAPLVENPGAPVERVQGTEVLAPMVGTFYSAASPDAQPYVQVGDEVQVGDTLCIIEAMKMMNNIEAEAAGRIAAIQVENGQPVEYGQVLFIID